MTVGIKGGGFYEFLKHVNSCEKRKEAMTYNDIFTQCLQTISSTYAYIAEYSRKTQNMLMNLPFSVNERGEVKLECNMCPIHCTHDVDLLLPPKGRPYKNGSYEEMNKKKKEEKE